MNLSRFSPPRIRELTPEEVAVDVAHLLAQAAVCCLSVDAAVPDENIRVILETVAQYHPNVP